MRACALRRRMLQVTITLMERASLSESSTTKDTYTRRLRMFLSVISVSVRYKYSSIIRAENAHLDTDHSFAIARKKSNDDDKSDPLVLDLELDFETNVIWKVWAFAVSEGLKDAISTAGKLKMKRSRQSLIM